MEQRIYFKNLNALRFFAAAAVIIHHIEQYKFWAGIPSLWGDTFIDALGHKAVSFFFVLSGFLITYLLLEEKRKTSDISVRNFYVRRILRIWPVYYLIVALCLLIVPAVFDLSSLNNHFFESNIGLKILLLVLVLPNVLRLFAPNIVGGNQLWSIGVEEQFYLIWPLLIRRFAENVSSFLIVFVLTKFILALAFQLLSQINPSISLSALLRFWNLLMVEQMAIGAIGASIVFHKKKNLQFLIFHRATLIISGIGFIILFATRSNHWMMNYVEGFIFLVIILNLSINPKIGVSLEHPVLTSLGNISYGIYMYHTLCITACLYALRETGLDKHNLFVFNLILYVAVTLFTITVSYLSYHYFEKLFLRVKERFMIVKSGNPPAELPVEKESMTGS